MATAVSTTPTLPPCDHHPRPYAGPAKDEVLALRKQFLNPTIFTYYAKPYRVRVCVRGGTTCVIAVVRDYCHGAWKALRKPWNSASRVIDLSPALFRQLAPLSLGIVYVEVSELGAKELGGVRRGY